MVSGNMEDSCSMNNAIDEDAIRDRFRSLLKEGMDVPADEEKEDLALPPYYDPQKFKLAQTVFRNNAFTMMIAKLSGLLTLLAIPSIVKVLKFTKQSGTTCLAFRRYTATILHTFVWYEKEPLKQIEFFKSLKVVRRKHCIVSRRCSEAGLPRITQTDMAITQFGFIGFTLLSGEQLGVKTTDEELESLMHFWKVIGYMLGMQDKYNLCNGTVHECRILCRQLLDEIFIPYFEKLHEDFDEMGRILIEGLWPVNPFLNPEAFISFTLQLATSATTNNNHSVVNDTSSLPLKSKILLNLQLSVHKYVMPTKYWWSTFFRAFLNFLMLYSIYLTETFPYLAYMMFGRKKSHVDIYKLHSD